MSPSSVFGWFVPAHAARFGDFLPRDVQLDPSLLSGLSTPFAEDEAACSHVQPRRDHVQSSRVQSRCLDSRPLSLYALIYFVFLLW